MQGGDRLERSPIGGGGGPRGQDLLHGLDVLAAVDVQLTLVSDWSQAA